MPTFTNPMVARAFDGYPEPQREQLLLLRQLIFEVAAQTPGVGTLEETLKWGEPAYLTTQSKSGSTIRLGIQKGTHAAYAIHFHCRTTLIESFRRLFPTEFCYQGNRSIVFQKDTAFATKGTELRHCLRMALTYHLNHRPRR